MMFSTYCARHDSRILMTRRNVVDFVNGPDGPAIHWRCNCGHEGVLDRNGNHPVTTGDRDLAEPLIA